MFSFLKSDTMNRRSIGDNIIHFLNVPAIVTGNVIGQTTNRVYVHGDIVDEVTEKLKKHFEETLQVDKIQHDNIMKFLGQGG